MALIKCPECGNNVSNKAKYCIHCGYPDLEDGEIELSDHSPDASQVTSETEPISAKNEAEPPQAGEYEEKFKGRGYEVSPQLSKEEPKQANGPSVKTSSCENCGEEIEEDVVTCSKCGNVNQREKISHGGIGRGAFLLGILLLCSFNFYASPSLTVIGWVLLFGCVLARLYNIGKSGWWSLGIFVPFFNLYILYICLAFPEGYAQTEKLDKAGKIIRWIGIILAITLIALFSIIVLFGS